MMMKRITGSICLLLLFATVSVTAFAQSSVYEVDGVALNGYDVVSYFTDGKPVKGSPSHSIVVEGITWQFANEDHLRRFAKDPTVYLPQFGGWCAYGVSEDHKSPTSPDAWTIVNGKLYLNYNTRVRKMWLEGRDERIKKADEIWVELKDK